MCHLMEERAAHNMATTQSSLLQLKHYGMQGLVGQELCTFNDNNYCTLPVLLLLVQTKAVKRSVENV